jgi:hypothetical protein
MAREIDAQYGAITTLAVNDCRIDLTEFDAELLTFETYHGRTITVRYDPHSALRYQTKARYLWLEAMGDEFDVSKVIKNKAMGAQFLDVTFKK